VVEPVRVEGGDPVTVLEGQYHTEVGLESVPDGVAGQGAQQLAALLFAGWWGGVVGERLGSGVQAGRDVADDLPGVRQRVTDDGDELGVVDRARLRTLEHRRGDIERHVHPP